MYSRDQRAWLTRRNPTTAVRETGAHGQRAAIPNKHSIPGLSACELSLINIRLKMRRRMDVSYAVAELAVHVTRVVANRTAMADQTFRPAVHPDRLRRIQNSSSWRRIPARPSRDWLHLDPRRAAAAAVATNRSNRWRTCCDCAAGLPRGGTR